MRDYRFSFGNTTTGEVGLCFSVEGDSEEQAIQAAQQIINDVGDGVDVDLIGDWHVSAVSVQLYLGSFTVTAAHIADVY